MFDGSHVYRINSYAAIELPRLTVYNLGFTGHRDWYCDDYFLMYLRAVYEGAIWVWGDADAGFDKQVKQYAQARGIRLDPIRPDYAMYSKSPRYAPIARNYKIVDKSDVLVALWDGRTSGGTYRTIDYADKLGKPIILLQPYRRVND